MRDFNFYYENESMRDFSKSIEVNMAAAFRPVACLGGATRDFHFIYFFKNILWFFFVLDGMWDDLAAWKILLRCAAMIVT